MTDVLTSVQKTEESLRRLKKIRDKSMGSSSSEVQGTSDDEKIRIQLQVDVQAYANMVRFIPAPFTFWCTKSVAMLLFQITEIVVSTPKVLHVEELLHAVETASRR